MRSEYVFLVVLLAECIFLASSAPVNESTSASVEYIETPTATEVVVFDDSASEVANENSEATTPQTLSGDGDENGSDSTQSDDLPLTTTTPCGNDIDSPDCPTEDSNNELPLSSKTNGTVDSSEESDEEKGTTVKP